MPHPAIMIDEREFENVTVKLRHVTGVTSAHGAVALRSLRIRQEPPSVENPKRPDGTRPVSPYWTKRILIQQRSARAEVTPNPDYWGWYVSPASPVDTWTEVKHLSPNELNDYFHDPLVAVRSDALARTQFLGKLADAAGKDQWELGVFAGEFREACGMAADLASGMVGGIARLSTIHRKPPRAISDTLSVYGEEGPKAALRALGSNDSSLLQNIVSGWLVVQFGLKPLFSDLVTATSLLNANLNNSTSLDTFTATVRGGGKAEGRFTRLASSAGAEANLYYDGFLDLYEEVKTSFSARYQLPIKPSVWQRLGLYNAPLVAWNLCRWSWMADYVSNVSPWLRSLMAGQDTKMIEGTKSVVRRTTLERGYSVGRYGCSVKTDPLSRDFILAADWFERTLLPPVGVLPTFLPSLKNRLNVDRLANATAALTTFYGSRSRPGVPVISY